MKKLILICTCVSCLFMRGCTYEAEYIKEDIVTDRLDENMEIPSLEQELEIIGENFTLICKYDTGSYDLSNWHVTDTKNITMMAVTNNLPEGYEVYIDHVHADISLKSTEPQLNGIMQDSMDDTFHGYSQDGFYIDDTTEYYNIFAIEGYTEYFFKMWGYAIGNYGSVQGTSSRLTEGSLIQAGTYAEKLTVVYDISIKKPESDHLYTKSVISELLIPISSEIDTVVKEYGTGRIIEETEAAEEEEEDLGKNMRLTMAFFLIAVIVVAASYFVGRFISDYKK